MQVDDNIRVFSYIMCRCHVTVRLIGTLLLGYVDDTGVKDDDDEDGHSYLPLQVGGFAVPAPRPPKTVPSLLPNDIDQDDDEVTS